MIKKTSNKGTSLFITFEGGEGAGKTTLIDFIEKELIANHLPILRTREPGGTHLGEQIRNWLLTRGTTPICHKAELLMFLGARAQHIEELIAPALRSGKIVLCDRFNDSSIAYQGAGRKLGVSWVARLCKETCGEILPNLTLYLDVDPKIGLARSRGVDKVTAPKGDVDRIEAEQLQFHQDVRQAFIDISKAEPKRFHILDANQPQASVLVAARKLIFDFIKHNDV